MSIPANPRLPCTDCGREERYLKMKRSDEWEFEHIDRNTGKWVARCPDCTGGGDDG